MSKMDRLAWSTYLAGAVLIVSAGIERSDVAGMIGAVCGLAGIVYWAYKFGVNREEVG